MSDGTPTTPAEIAMARTLLAEARRELGWLVGAGVEGLETSFASAAAGEVQLGGAPESPASSREQRLNERGIALRTRIRWTNRFRLLCLLTAIFFLIATAYTGLKIFSVSREMQKLELRLQSAEPLESAVIQGNLRKHDAQYDQLETQMFGGILLSIPLLVLCLVISPRARQSELIDVSNELDLVSIPSISYEQKAQKLLQMQQLELKRYYVQTLHQSAYIFWVGVADMVVGIVVVIGTIYYVHSWGTNDFSEKMIVGIVGAIAGVLTNFVGVMYIKMFSEIVKGVTHSHDSLVTMNHLHLANLFVADIGDKELREKTLSELALAMRASLNRLADSNASAATGLSKVS